MERPRCPVQELLVGDDGCLRCLRDREPKRRNLGVPVVAGVVSLTLSVMIGARAVSAVRKAVVARAVAEPEIAAAKTAPMATEGTTDTAPATGAIATTSSPRRTRAASTALCQRRRPRPNRPWRTSPSSHRRHGHPDDRHRGGTCAPVSARAGWSARSRCMPAGAPPRNGARRKRRPIAKATLHSIFLPIAYVRRV
jgi:hypothetical protein